MDGILVDDRVKFFRLSFVALKWFLERAPARTTLPADARVVFVQADNETRKLKVYIVSEQFEPVPEGEMVPEIQVVMET